MKKIMGLCLFGVILGGLFCWWLTEKWMADGLEPEADGTNDYAIVLGAKVKQDRPSLSLLYRMEAALAYAEAYPHVTLIVSGGQGADEPMSEAEAMRQFLTDNGIAEERLIIEDRSTSTYENLLFSKELLPSTVDSVTIITSDFHLARARKLAARLEIQTDGVAAKTPQVVEEKLKMRERLALVKTYIVGK